MAATPEARVKAAIRRKLKAAGAYYVMPIGTGFGTSGVLDFSVCHKGRYIGIEAKAGKNQPTALQLKNIADIRAAGGIALVINEDNLHELDEVLNG